MIREKEVHIWSGEREAWWRPDAKGYTGDIGEAGVYSLKEGAEIIADADPEKELVLVLTKESL